jgi:hypothetical protein
MFEPKFLHQLVDNLYEDQHTIIKEHELKRILETDNNKGMFWEKVLEKHMPFTKRLKANAWYKDFADGTDAKFATAVRYTSGVFQATIGNVENKTGHLRVCMVGPGDKNRKLYFMVIPPSYYRKSPHPIKITFKNFYPMGEAWDKYQCSFQEVTNPIVDINSEVVYTDDYQYLLESNEIHFN